MIIVPAGDGDTCEADGAKGIRRATFAGLYSPRAAMVTPAGPEATPTAAARLSLASARSLNASLRACAAALQHARVEAVVAGLRVAGERPGGDESGRLVQRARRGEPRRRAGLEQHAPVAALPRGIEQVGEQRPAHAAAAGLGGGVHRLDLDVPLAELLNGGHAEHRVAVPVADERHLRVEQPVHVKREAMLG